jgi:hypothetical protein
VGTHQHEIHLTLFGNMIQLNRRIIGLGEYADCVTSQRYNGHYCRQMMPTRAAKSSATGSFYHR